MWDIYRFCVRDNGIICIGTTFEICDGLYLTDTTYPYLSLHGINGKHPEFPGPSFWHFKRTRETYCRLAGELLIYEPLLIDLHKIGHHLDEGLAEGINFWLIQFYLGWGGVHSFLWKPFLLVEAFIYGAHWNNRTINLLIVYTERSNCIICMTVPLNTMKLIKIMASTERNGFH